MARHRSTQQKTSGGAGRRRRAAQQRAARDGRRMRRPKTDGWQRAAHAEGADSDAEDGEEQEGGEDGQDEDSEARDGTSKCDFCAHDSVGQAMDAQTPCDWRRINRSMAKGCSNCANYRAGRTTGPLRCRAQQFRGWTYPQYADADPADYLLHSCDGCRGEAREATCDLDHILGIGCSWCLKKKRRCEVGSHAMELAQPRVRQTAERWWRRACGSCMSVAREASRMSDMCSWLEGRARVGRRCSRCARDNLACNVDDHHLVPPPARWTVPGSWCVGNLRDLAFAELRGHTPWRSACGLCADNAAAHCRASMDRPWNACNRCQAWGTTCVGARDAGSSSSASCFFPLWSLALVGFGLLAPFRACFDCLLHARNCDRQRPCDSCHARGLPCDPFVAGDRVSKGCIPHRLSPRPGPLYYLALGYGPAGVDDVKTGHQIEHWVGPRGPWGVLGAHDASAQRLAAQLARLRSERDSSDVPVPVGIPPHGTLGDASAAAALALVRPHDASVQQIRDAIRQNWPNVVAPAQTAWSLVPADVTRLPGLNRAGKTASTLSKRTAQEIREERAQKEREHKYAAALARLGRTDGAVTTTSEPPLAAAHVRHHHYQHQQQPAGETSRPAAAPTGQCHSPAPAASTLPIQTSLALPLPTILALPRPAGPDDDDDDDDK